MRSALNDVADGPAADGAALIAPLELIRAHLAAAGVAAGSEARAAHLAHADEAEACLLTSGRHQWRHQWHWQP